MKHPPYPLRFFPSARFALSLPLFFFAAAIAIADSNPLPPFFQIGKGRLVGFFAPDGSLAVSPRFEACSRRWSEGCLWVVDSLDQYFSGNFLDSSGALLLSSPAGRYADDLVAVPPAFENGRAIVEISPGRFAVATHSGLLLDRDSSPPSSPAPREANGRWGLSAPNGQWLLPPDCDSILPGDFGTWIAKRGDKIGLLSSDGAWIHPPAFDSIHNWGAKVVAVRENGLWGILDAIDGRMLVPARYEAIDLPGPRAAWARRDGKWGLLSYSNSMLQPFEFDSVLWLCADEDVWKPFQRGRAGAVAAGGQTILPCNFASVDLMAFPFLAVRADSGVGLFDAHSLRWAVPPHFDQAICWPELPGLAAVRSGPFWGLVNLADGKTILPAEHDSLRPWNSLVEARKSARSALFAPDGSPVLPWSAEASELPDPDRAMPGGFGKIVCRGKAGLVDSHGSIRLPCDFDDLGFCSEGLVPACRDRQWGFLNLGGNWAIPPQFAEARPFSGGMAAVRQNDRFGFIAPSGELLVHFLYADAGQAAGGLVPVADVVDGQRLWGLLRADGSFAIPAAYDAIEWPAAPFPGTVLHGHPQWERL